ncbi:hypothetical protein [Actinomadura chibensis]|uniref:hypothetical protein n=1 Tax=Actinomadura chibensis TaxID=392828 RepID=UPI001C3F2A3F|nr:hypothetical protein [Actinomadura chibensis]
MKGRSRKTVRPVPIPPELVAILRYHIDVFGVAKDGRLFRSVNGNIIQPSTYWRVWQRAREIGLTPEERDSPLMRRPYDLRHGGVSVRLYAGIPPTQVAEWAGHSPEVLQKIYAKVVAGFEDVWLDRLDAVLARSPRSSSRSGTERVPRGPRTPYLRSSTKFTNRASGAVCAGSNPAGGAPQRTAGSRA